jgi:hypothetical protein
MRKILKSITLIIQCIRYSIQVVFCSVEVPALDTLNTVGHSLPESDPKMCRTSLRFHTSSPHLSRMNAIKDTSHVYKVLSGSMPLRCVSQVCRRTVSTRPTALSPRLLDRSSTFGQRFRVRLLHASVSLRDDVVPLRKQLKDKSKAARASQSKQQAKTSKQDAVEGWELTVGIEIHAQLNTARKLFSGTILHHFISLVG